jgi:hypothetical protein
MNWFIRIWGISYRRLVKAIKILEIILKILNRIHNLIMNQLSKRSNVRIYKKISLRNKWVVSINKHLHLQSIKIINQHLSNKRVEIVVNLIMN